GTTRDLEDDPRHVDEMLDTPKVPAPERPVPASELLDVARAVGLATVAVADVYGAFPNTLADHRVRAAIKHNALLADLPDTFTAHAPAHLLSPGEMRSFYNGVAECSGPFQARDDGALARSLDI